MNYVGGVRGMEHSLGFLGFGEAASQIACGFHTQGITENAAYDVAMNTKGGQKKLLGERLQETDVKMCIRDRCRGDPLPQHCGACPGHDFHRAPPVP